MRSDYQQVKKKLLRQGFIGDVEYPVQSLAVDTDKNGHVRLNFSRPLTWFTLPPGEALVLAKTLAARAGAKRIEIE